MQIEEASPPVPEQLLRVPDIARKLRCSPRQIHRLVAAGRLPKPLRIGGMLRWPPSVIQHWIDAGCPTIQITKG